jgi:hypothetical protein
MLVKPQILTFSYAETLTLYNPRQSDVPVRVERNARTHARAYSACIPILSSMPTPTGIGGCLTGPDDRPSISNILTSTEKYMHACKCPRNGSYASLLISRFFACTDTCFPCIHTCVACIHAYVSCDRAILRYRKVALAHALVATAQRLKGERLRMCNGWVLQLSQIPRFPPDSARVASL